MSITTNLPLNHDALDAAIPSGGSYTWTGHRLDEQGAKEITATGFDDTVLQAAITAAASAFTDRSTNAATIRAKANQALQANATYLAIQAPTNAQVVAEVRLLAQAVNALIRLEMSDFTGTG